MALPSATVFGSQTRVLGIIDVLARVFQNCDKPSLAACARVNRFWEDAALRELWREIDNVFPLFQLLAPIGQETGCFSSPPLSKNWSRYYRYAGWIRTLRFSIGSARLESSDEEIDPTVLADASIVASSFDLPLIPQVISLEVTASGAQAVKSTICLLQPSIRKLSLALSETTSDHNVLLLTAMPRRCSLLTGLIITCGDDLLDGLTVLSEELGQTIRLLPYLTNVYLNPQVALHPIIWESLSTRPHLSVLYFAQSYPTQLPNSHLDKDLAQSLSFTSHSFPELECLEISVNHTAALTLFAGPLPPKLREIDIRLCGAPRAVDIECILSRLASNAPRLVAVLVTSLDSRPVLSMNHIRPILIERLRVLYIQMDAMLDLSDSDMLHIVISIPNIEKLYLAPDPIHSPSTANPGLTLRALSICAQFCPSLRTLELCLDARLESNPDPSSSRHSFAELETLNLGFTSCPNPLLAAIHISAATRSCNPRIMSGFLQYRSQAQRGAKARLERCGDELGVALEMIPLLRNHVIKSWGEELDTLRSPISGHTAISTHTLTPLIVS